MGARTDQVLSSSVLMPLVGSVRILLTLEGSVVVPTADTLGLTNRIGMKGRHLTVRSLSLLGVHPRRSRRPSSAERMPPAGGLYVNCDFRVHERPSKGALRAEGRGLRPSSALP